jgi:hypothetical protein
MSYSTQQWLKDVTNISQLWRELRVPFNITFSVEFTGPNGNGSHMRYESSTNITVIYPNVEKGAGMIIITKLLYVVRVPALSNHKDLFV